MQVKRHRTNTSVGLGQFKCEGDALNDATCRYIAGDIKGHERTPNIFVRKPLSFLPPKKNSPAPLLTLPSLFSYSVLSLMGARLTRVPMASPAATVATTANGKTTSLNILFIGRPIPKSSFPKSPFLQAILRGSSACLGEVPPTTETAAREDGHGHEQCPSRLRHGPLMTPPAEQPNRSLTSQAARSDRLRGKGDSPRCHFKKISSIHVAVDVKIAGHRTQQGHIVPVAAKVGNEKIGAAIVSDETTLGQSAKSARERTAHVNDLKRLLGT